jgi:hypothetical protein
MQLNFIFKSDFEIVFYAIDCITQSISKIFKFILEYQA